MRLEKEITQDPLEALIKSKKKDCIEGKNPHYIEINYTEKGEIKSIKTTDPDIITEAKKNSFIETT